MPARTTSSFTIIIIFILLSVAGLALMPMLPLQLVPEYNYQTIGVSFGYPGASPRTVEERVTSVIEARLSMLSEVRNVRSTSGNGYGRIILDIDQKADINLVRYEVTQAIGNIYPQLPKGLFYPDVYTWGSSPDERPILTYTALANHNDEGLAAQIEKFIVNPLQQVRGVGQVSMHGIAPFRWNIVVDFKKMANLGIPLHSLYDALRWQQGQFPLGLTAINKSTNKQVVIKGLPGNCPGSLINLPVHKGPDGRKIFLGDIADVKREVQPVGSYYRLNGQNTVFINVFAASGQNHLNVGNRAKQKVLEINQNLPENINLELVADNTEYISGEINQIIRRSLLALALLLVFTWIISFNARYILVITISLLCNLAINFFVYYLLGVQLNLYSFAGITVSLGLLIDNSIVMVDHIKHKHNKKVFRAILASTLTTIASLSVIFFLDRTAQLSLADFATVLIVNLGVSLFIALFLIPALIDKIPLTMALKKGIYFRRKKRVQRVNHIYSRLVMLFARYKKVWVVILILSFGLPVFLLPGKIDNESFWASIYNKTLGSDTYQGIIGPVVEKILGGTLRVFAEKVDHGQFYSDEQQTMIIIHATLEEGSTIGQMNEVFISLENYLKQFREIDRFETNIYGPEYARLTITFEPEYELTAFPHILQNQLITKAIGFSSLDSRIVGVGDGFINSMLQRVGNFKVEITGHNYDQVYRIAERFRQGLIKHRRIKEANIMGSDDEFRFQNWEYVMEVDREILAYKNMAYSQLANFLNLMTTTEQYIGIVEYNQQNEFLVLSSGVSGQVDHWQLRDMVIPAGNTRIKPGVLTNIAKQQKPVEINKYNQQYVVYVEWDFIGPSDQGRMVANELLMEFTPTLPLGYNIENRQRTHASHEERKIRVGLILLVVLIIYLICAVLFESLWQPLAVISLVPVTFTGVFLAFWISGIPFDQGGYAALILLCGLTVNSAVFIINEMNNVTKETKNSGNRVYFMAYRSKIVPIVLTILSTLVGMIPFLLASQKTDFWFPLALATSSGLLFSIIGIMLVLPMFFVKTNKQPFKRRLY